MRNHFPLIVFSSLMLFACGNQQNNDAETVNANVTPAPAVMNYQVLKIYPHDTSSFTEGLIWLNNSLYESTGLNKQSKLLRVNLETGKAFQKVILPDIYFGEGISVLNNKIYQLTYREHKVFVYDMNFKKLPQEFEWPFEGWGMTTDGTHLIINTGGSNLYFVNPETFKIERTLGVTDQNGYVDSINEMEYLDGYVYANRYLKDDILKINLKTGIVEAKADLSGIFEKNNISVKNSIDVLNGIAYDAVKKTFYITGKNWPNLFEVRFN
jgi:glutamine cyclotransferase